MTTIVVPRSTMDIVLTCDPAISERSAACRSAITVAAITPYTKIFLLETWCGRQGDPAKLIEQILKMADYWQPRCVGVEMVVYQLALKPYIEREMQKTGKYYQIIPMKPDRNEKKNQRILSLQPFFRSGQVYIQHGMLDFINEFESFPNGRTVDLLDAFAYAVRLLAPQQPDHKPGVEMQLTELASRDPQSARYWRRVAERAGTIDALPTIDDVWEEAGSEDDLEGVGEFV